MPPADPPCPACGSKRFRYSASLSKHLARMVKGSHRRYCPSCGNKWTDDDKSDGLSGKLALIRGRSLPIIIGIGVGLLATIFAGVSFNPVDWFKGRVVQAYHDEHGKKHTKDMWHDLKGFYGSRGEAISDYRGHSN